MLENPRKRAGRVEDTYGAVDDAGDGAGMITGALPLGSGWPPHGCVWPEMGTAS